MCDITHIEYITVLVLRESLLHFTKYKGSFYFLLKHKGYSYSLINFFFLHKGFIDLVGPLREGGSVREITKLVHLKQFYHRYTVKKE